MKNKTNFLNAFLFSSLSLISLAQATNINDDEELQQALALSMAQTNDDEDLQQALALSMMPTNVEISKNEKELEKVLETSKKEFNEAEDEELALALSMSTMITNHEDKELKKEKELKKALEASKKEFDEAEDEELALAFSMSNVNIGREEKELKKALKASKNQFNEAEAEDDELALALLMSTQEDQYNQAIAASLAIQANPFSNTTDVEDGVVAPVRGGLMNRLSNLEQSRRNITTNDTTDELAQRLQRRRDLNGEDR